ncbi:MAG: flagellar export chaperone FliS [Comamonas sp.]|jgi:flagellar protein FliS|nr:flagellar export chaperone FliS [Comamonas sp.]
MNEQIWNEGYGGYRAANMVAQTAQASPVELVLMLVDGLLEEMARLRMHIEHQRFEEKAHSIAKCADILTGLGSALEADAGNGVVENLSRLYDFCAHRLNQAGFEMDVSKVDEVLGIVQTLRAGWQGMADARL